MRRVRRISRFTALALVLVLTNLTLVVSGYACVVHPDASPSAGLVSMNGMVMGQASHQSATALPAAHAAAATIQDGTESPPEGPCKFPWAPGGCESMAPCAPAALTAARASVAAVPRARHEVSGLTVTLLPSEQLAPEPPPPRV